MTLPDTKKKRRIEESLEVGRGFLSDCFFPKDQLLQIKSMDFLQNKFRVPNRRQGIQDLFFLMIQN